MSSREATLLDAAPPPGDGSGSAVFDTSLGLCGIAWGPDGLRRTALPDDDPARLTKAFRTHPDRGPIPQPVADAIARIVALLDGLTRDDDLTDIGLDMGGVGEFDRAVYAVARAIPPGETLTYGVVAARVGDTGLARAVGGALGRNPFPIVVPCHRVLAAGGRLGGFSAPGGGLTKLRLLQIERARTSPQPLLFDELSAAPRR